MSCIVGPYAYSQVKYFGSSTEYVKDAKNMTIQITRMVVVTMSLLNFAGSFMEACKLITKALPSKLNTATPKNRGMCAGVK